MTRKNKDIRTFPSYGVSEAAHYLRIPAATIRFWINGQRYQTVSGSRKSRSIISLPDKQSRLMSFNNLAEAYVLDAIRKEHSISLQKIRRALDYLKRTSAFEHPLIEHDFMTDGLDLFIEQYGKLISISRAGQLEMKEVIQAYLRRIEYDEDGLVAKLFPFTRKRNLDEPKLIVIDPYISFGRPVLAGTGIATSTIAERYKAGESISSLAADFNCNFDNIEEAIRCELSVNAA